MDCWNRSITYLMLNVSYKYGKGVNKKMAVYKVENLTKVNPTRYIEGDLFITKKSAALLLNGKIEPIIKQSDLKGYVKRNDVQKMIDKAMKEGGEKNE